jgi:hypothetical protein
VTTVDIVLVGYRSEQYLPRLLEDIESMSSLPHKVHYFDNLGNTKTLSRLWNELAAAGDGQYIAIMNPDIALCPGWDERLVEVLRKYPMIGVSSPNPIGSSPTAEPMPSREDMAKLAAELTNVSHLRMNEAMFFLPMVRRSNWDLLKGVDERFRFYMQDSDFQKRIEWAGLKNCIVQACPVWHRGSASTGAALEKKEIDQSVEYNFGFSVWREVREGRWKLWHLLTDQERAALRADERFSKMGVRHPDWEKLPPPGEIPS